ncbi:MAG: hypothetical protein OXR66_06330 [Candidatus Woesearchaeota archaeon]|nr:hypothetical protein [Candidatus Woesearchaeota archaeon]
MMNRYLVAVVLMTFVLVGCQPTESEVAYGDIADPFIGGNIGLNMYLQDGAPPPQIYDGGKFPFVFNTVIENVGEADIGPTTENPYVSARIEGINPATFGVTQANLHQSLQEPIRGARKNFDGTIIGGMIANFVFENLNYQGKLQGNDLITLRGQVCYDYNNVATSQLCFKNDIIENVEDISLCTLTGEKIVHNSGGPIHVTSIIQNPLGSNKVQANFIIEHVGPGEFYGRQPDEDCDPNIRNTNKHKVEVDVWVEDPNAYVQCFRLDNSNHGTITLYNGIPQTVTCTITGGAPEARVYTDILTVKTSYRYGQFIEQPIVIQALPQDFDG